MFGENKDKNVMERDTVNSTSSIMIDYRDN